MPSSMSSESDGPNSSGYEFPLHQDDEAFPRLPADPTASLQDAAEHMSRWGTANGSLPDRVEHTEEDGYEHRPLGLAGQTEPALHDTTVALGGLAGQIAGGHESHDSHKTQTTPEAAAMRDILAQTLVAGRNYQNGESGTSPSTVVYELLNARHDMLSPEDADALKQGARRDIALETDRHNEEMRNAHIANASMVDAANKIRILLQSMENDVDAAGTPADSRMRLQLADIYESIWQANGAHGVQSTGVYDRENHMRRDDAKTGLSRFYELKHESIKPFEY